MRRVKWMIGIMAAAALLAAVNTKQDTAYAADVANVPLDGAELPARENGGEPDKIYGICSISKVYVTCAAMQLADKGLINLDEPVVTYIPEFEMVDERYKDITVRMLMNHTSGLMGTTVGTSFLYDDNDETAHDELLKYLKGQRLKADPGAFSTYCNDGFDLLELVVERVSGQDFTEYMTEHIVKPIGGSQTGTYKNLFGNENLAAVYDDDKHPFATEYHIGIGTGGILSTAPELCRFGSTFFTGDNTLLSEDAKNAMAEDESGNQYEGHYALGWDDVDAYADADVKVVYKGGDLTRYHGALAVAPEEKISVAVLTSGASSSIDLMFAQSLINVVLDDRGIEVPEAAIPISAIVDTVPAEYADYEGIYADGSSMYRVTFPDGKYMQMEALDDARSRSEYYKYTEGGGFVRMKGDVPAGNGIIDSDILLVDFAKRDNGRTYLVSESLTEEPRLGAVRNANYNYEKLEDYEVSDAAKQAWSARCGKYYLTDVKYSAITFDNKAFSPSIHVKMSDTDDTYIYAYGLMRIKDENKAVSFVNIPGHAGRDLSDITAKTVDGVEYIEMDGKGLIYVSDESFSEFTSDIKEVTFDKRDVKWYNIGENMGGALISLEKSEKTSVYIYDKYDKCIYNTYMTGYGDIIRLPKEGKIMFAGEAGEKISILQ